MSGIFESDLFRINLFPILKINDYNLKRKVHNLCKKKNNMQRVSMMLLDRDYIQNDDQLLYNFAFKKKHYKNFFYTFLTYKTLTLPPRITLRWFHFIFA